MHDQVKRSLDKVFEHEYHHQKETKRMKKPMIPILITVVVLCAITVVTSALIKGSLPATTTTQTASDKATLDHLYGEYVGNNSAVSEITSTILYAAPVESIALQTKKEPYGVTVNLSQTISQPAMYKHAIYMFSLIKNVAYIEYAVSDNTTILSKAVIAESYDVDFNAVKGDEAIMTTYYETIAQLLPQLQTNREDGNKYAFNAVNVHQVMSDFTTSEDPTVSFLLEDTQYVLWQNINETEAIYIVDCSQPSQAIVVEGTAYEELIHYLQSDYELVTGVVQEIIDNQLLITAGTQSDVSYLVTVDQGKNFTTGETVTVWSTRSTRSIPAQAVATKILNL